MITIDESYIKVCKLTKNMAAGYINYLRTEHFLMVIFKKVVIVFGIIGRKNMNTSVV